MNTIASTALVAWVLAYGPAGAATLGLETTVPKIETSFALIDYLEFGGDGDLSTFGAEIYFTDGVAPSGFTEISFAVGFSLSDPTSGATGGFDVFDEDGLFLDGDLKAVGFTEDTIELEFDNIAVQPQEALAPQF
jgi:hypothetical protein